MRTTLFLSLERERKGPLATTKSKQRTYRDVYQRWCHHFGVFAEHGVRRRFGWCCRSGGSAGVGAERHYRTLLRLQRRRSQERRMVPTVRRKTAGEGGRPSRILAAGTYYRRRGMETAQRMGLSQPRSRRPTSHAADCSGRRHDDDGVNDPTSLDPGISESLRFFPCRP